MVVRANGNDGREDNGKGGKKINEENQIDRIDGIHMHPNPGSESELGLTAACPADSSGRRCRCAGRCRG